MTTTLDSMLACSLQKGECYCEQVGDDMLNSFLPVSFLYAADILHAIAHDSVSPERLSNLFQGSDIRPRVVSNWGSGTGSPR